MENQVTNNNDEIENRFKVKVFQPGKSSKAGRDYSFRYSSGSPFHYWNHAFYHSQSMNLPRRSWCLNKTGQIIRLPVLICRQSTQLTKDYAELIQSRTVLEGVIAQLNLDMTYKEMLNKVSVETSSDSRIVSISVTDEDPYTASEIANAVRDMAAEHIQSVMDIEAVNVVDTANIPNEKASPSLAKNGVIGGLLGVIIAMAAVIIIYLTNDTIKVEEDVERYLGLSVLGSIPFSEKESRSKKKKSRKRR